MPIPAKASNDYRREIKNTFVKYGLEWNVATPPFWIELAMVKKGGHFKRSDGSITGNGLEYHFKAAAKLLWPSIAWHHWNELLVHEWLEHRYVGVLGPTSSGKTHTAAWCHLLWYYAFPGKTTIIVCSTTRERLEDRIWGEMKKLHKEAKRRFSWLPGHLIEGRLRIVTDDKDEVTEGRDFKSGVLGVPCKKGDKYTGLGDFIGIKNEYLFLCGDELQLLPAAFIDSLANVMKGRNRKVTGMGNPAETTDSLGKLCEPAASLGGWDGGIDQGPKSKTWETRWPDGVCVQLCGSDSPNNVAAPGDPAPYPFLITREDMARDAQVWGVDDWHYTMFNEGRMPRGQGSRRVLTRNLCLKNHALEEPVWSGAPRTKIAFLDAAYRGVGGDRCVFGELDFGFEVTPPQDVSASAIINQNSAADPKRQIMALIDLVIVPITSTHLVVTQEEAEDQIVKFVMDQCGKDKRNIPPQNFFFDAGMRTTLVSAFGRLWSPAVNTIDFGGTASNRLVSDSIEVLCKDYYSKFVTELWFSVRLVVESGQFRGMTEDVMQEGCTREWKKVGNNKIEVETKAEMKEKTGRSPDLFDALACGVEGARRLGFKTLRIRNREVKRQDEQWKRDLQEKAKELWTGSALSYK